MKAIPLGGYISMAGMFPPGKVKKGAVARAGHLRDELELDILEGDMHDTAEDAALQRPAERTTVGVTSGSVAGTKPKMDSTGFFSVLVQDARDSSAKTIDPGDEDRVFYKLAFWKRIIIMLGGPAVNLILAVVFYAIVICLVGTPGYTTTVGEVSQCMAQTTSQSAANKTCAASDPATPAAEGGLKPGDKVLSINGTSISTYDQETAVIRDSIGKPLTFVVDRDGAQKSLTVTPVKNTVTDASGKTVVAGFIGIVTSQELVVQPVTAVLPAVGTNISRVAGIILDLPHRLVQTAQAAFGGEKRDPNGPISVVGVGRIAGAVDELDRHPRAGAGQRNAADRGIPERRAPRLQPDPVAAARRRSRASARSWEAVRRRFAKWFKRPRSRPGRHGQAGAADARRRPASSD